METAHTNHIADQNLSVRKATHAEIPYLQELIARSVRGLSAGYYTADQTEAAIQQVFGVDTQLIEDGTYFVAALDGVIVGCGGWSRRATMYGGDQAKPKVDDEIDPLTSAARIRAFFVDPRFARMGVGRAILNHCVRDAAAYGFRSAELVATLPGVPLYSACGFVAAEPVNIDLGSGLQLPCIRMNMPILIGAD